MSQIGTRFEQMRRKAMPKRVRMDAFLDACSLGGVMTRMPNGVRIDRLIGAMTLISRKEPDLRSSRQAVPVLMKFFEQFRTEHHVAVFAPFATLNANDHALLVEVAELQPCHLTVPGAGGVESHQQSALEGSAGRLDQSCDFFLA